MGDTVTRVNRFILDVVEKQLTDGAPSQTRETLERLRASGFSEEDAKHLIGSAVVAEMRSVVEERRAFSEERYIANLDKLPFSGSN
jgi:hypothetical protein